jgi:hypothetical protein
MKFSNKIKTLSVVMIISAVFAMSFLPTAMIYGKSNQDKSPVVTTNKGDYSPDMKVIILGKNFEPNTAYIVQIIRPNGDIFTGDGTSTPGSDTVTTNGGGNFNYHYTLCGVDGIFNVNIIGSDDGKLKASTSFTDATVRW